MATKTKTKKSKKAGHAEREEQLTAVTRAMVHALHRMPADLYEVAKWANLPVETARDLLDELLDLDQVRFDADRKAYVVRPEEGWPVDEWVPPVGVSREWEVRLADLVDVEQLHWTPLNPRQVDESTPVATLQASIEAVGVQHPLICRPSPHGGDRLEVICGARRLLAARRAKVKRVPVVVRELNDDEARELIAIEYCQREDLTPIEEARGVQALLDAGWRLDDVAERLGHSPQWVARRARLTKLIPAWQQAIADSNHRVSQWPPAHFRAIARLIPMQQAALLSEIDANPWLFRELPKLSDLERKLGECRRLLAAAQWDRGDAELLPDAGACTSCPHRASMEPRLFDDLVADHDDVCLDGSCWEAKRLAHFRRLAESATTEADEQVLLLHQQHPIREQDRSPVSVPAWDFEGCKKSDPGARPAIRVDSEQPEVEWVRLNQRASSKPTRSVDPETGEVKPKSLKERRLELKRRRIAHALDLIRDRLETHLDEDELSQHAVISLVAAFGSATHSSDFDIRKAVGTDLRRPMAELIAQLWMRVRPVLQARWKPVAPITSRDQVEQQWAEVELIAGMIGLSSEDALSQATREIPEPNSWSKE